MVTRKGSLFLLAFLGVFLAIKAQPKMVLDKELHNYGEIFESSNGRSVFTISNVGTDTLKITQVHAECGCTTPKLGMYEIPPGRSTVMNVKYEAKGRIGQFNKKIAIYSNSNPAVKLVYISGLVKPDALNGKSNPLSKAQLSLNTYKLNLDTMHHLETKYMNIVVSNNSKQDKHINALLKMPKWITHSLDGRTVIKPNEEVIVEFAINLSGSGQFGNIRQYFNIMTDDRQSPAKLILIEGFVEPFFESIPTRKKALKKWKAQQPKAIVNQSLINYDTINSGATTTHQIELTNEGEDTLVIYKLYSVCGCLTISSNKTQIAKGEKAILTLTFDSINRKGRQRKSAYILTNDPYNKQMVFSIDGFVKR